MEKEKRIKLILIIIVITLGLACIFEVIFFEHLILPRQERVLDQMYGEMFIQVNEKWIDVWEGKRNLTENDINKIKLSLVRLEEALKNE